MSEIGNFLSSHPVISNKLLHQGHKGDAGFDIEINEDIVIFPYTVVSKVKTGIVLAIPKGMYGQIVERSSIGAMGIKVLGGVIDSGYRGEILLNLANLSGDVLEFKRGERIAQIIFLYSGAVVVYGNPYEVGSDRGADGFGSTGR